MLGSLHELVPLIKKPINRFRFRNSKGFGPVRLCINIETVVDIHCFHIGDSPVLPRPTAWRQSGIERWQEEEEEGCYSDLNIASIEKYDMWTSLYPPNISSRGSCDSEYESDLMTDLSSGEAGEL